MLRPGSLRTSCSTSSNVADAVRLVTWRSRRMGDAGAGGARPADGGRRRAAAAHEARLLEVVALEEADPERDAAVDLLRRLDLLRDEPHVVVAQQRDVLGDAVEAQLAHVELDVGREVEQPRGGRRGGEV